MKKACQIIVSLLAIAFMVAPLHADTAGNNDNNKWCGKAVFDSNHPMYQKLDEHKKLLKKTPWEEQIVKRKALYTELLHAFTMIYSKSQDFEDKRVRTIIKALEKYIQQLDVEGEKPIYWNATPKKNEPKMKFPGISLYLEESELIEINCSVFEEQDSASAVLGAAYLSRYVESLSRVGLKDLQFVAAAEADLISKGYQSWLFKGLAQWPWELKLNEILMPDDFNKEAPDWQLTLLRPNLGFAINPNDYNNADLDFSLMLEPVGFIKYLKDDGKTDYEHWWGL